MTFSKLIKKLNKYLSEKDVAEINEAFQFAKEAHAGQFRKTGEPYIEHSLSIALTLAEMELGKSAIIAALLHDVPEDTLKTIDDVRNQFGDQVAQLVDGVTKLGQVRYRGGESEREIETLRKMFLAMAKDMRVVVIKLADRLHNMQTLEGLLPEKRERFARETLEIFAPLADRFGIWRLKWQLEDLAFQWLYPKEFVWVSSLVKDEAKSRERYIQKVKKFLEKFLAKKGIHAEISGRAKHKFSLYKKLLRYDRDISKIYDLLALRVVVETIDDCYKALGIIHSIWSPLANRIKDFIAVPKANGYRSLHTTVFCLDGKLTEIQIRTFEMDQEAKFGVAAHWAYSKENEKVGTKEDIAAFAPPKILSWVKQFSEIQEELKSSKELEENLKIDIFQDRIFVFTPNGDAKDLPKGATPVDFAYAVHSNIGDHCIGAKVNTKIVPLNYQLQNSEVVEILTSKNATPSRDWLKFVRTAHARTKIRSFFKQVDRDKNIIAGKELLNKELSRFGKGGIESIGERKIKKALEALSYKNLDDVFAALGDGSISASQIIKRLFSQDDIFGPSRKKTVILKDKTEIEAKIAGMDGILTKFANCCKPEYPDEIIGFITRGKGVIIHRKECRNIHSADQKRLIKMRWEGGQKEVYPVELKILVTDRVGMIADISSVIAAANINITDFKITHLPEGQEFIHNVVVDISNFEQLDNLIDGILKIKGVKSVKKV